MSNAYIGSTGEGFDGSVSIAVVTAVANRRNASPTELPPLYEWIDPDALDALFEPTVTGGQRRGRVAFAYDGHEITVTYDGDLEITVDGTPVSASAGGIGSSAGASTDA